MVQRINYKLHNHSNKLHDFKWRINSKPVSKKQKRLKKVFQGDILDSNLSIKYWYSNKALYKNSRETEIQKGFSTACLHCGCFRRQPCCYKLFIKTLGRSSVVFFLYGLVLSLYWRTQTAEIIKISWKHRNILTVNTKLLLRRNQSIYCTSSSHLFKEWFMSHFQKE